MTTKLDSISLRYEEALTNIAKAIELEPDNAEYYKGRSIILRKLGRFKEAVADEKTLENLLKKSFFYIKS